MAQARFIGALWVLHGYFMHLHAVRNYAATESLGNALAILLATLTSPG
jgi:hypothetical protein